MKLRIKLTIFIVIALLVIPLSQYVWILLRHDFLRRYAYSHTAPVSDRSSRCPWSLKLLGEPAINYMTVPPELVARAEQLFPEAAVTPADTTTTTYRCRRSIDG